MGDVAISAPLVRAYAVANPNCNFYMVSQPRFEAMFSYPSQQCAPLKGITESIVAKEVAIEGNSTERVKNLYYIPLNTKRGAADYCGSWRELIKFAKTVKKQYGVTHFADIHDVLRTKVLRFALKLSGVKVACINKHRKERNALCRKENKKFEQIIKSQRCMEEVLINLGLKDIHFADASPSQSAVAKENTKVISHRKDGVKEAKNAKIYINQVDEKVVTPILNVSSDENGYFSCIKHNYSGKRTLRVVCIAPNEGFLSDSIDIVINFEGVCTNKTSTLKIEYGFIKNVLLWELV